MPTSYIKIHVPPLSLHSCCERFSLGHCVVPVCQLSFCSKSCCCLVRLSRKATSSPEYTGCSQQPCGFCEHAAAAVHRQASRCPIAIRRHRFAAFAKTALCKPHQSGTRIATKGFLQVEKWAHVSSALSLLQPLTFNNLHSFFFNFLVTASLCAAFQCVSRRLREPEHRHSRFMPALDHITQLWR
jgi:hypothetical protein